MMTSSKKNSVMMSNDIFVNGFGLSELPPLLTTQQAAAILNVHQRTVARMCELGKLKAVRVMSVWRINRDALFDLVMCGDASKSGDR